MKRDAWGIPLCCNPGVQAVGWTMPIAFRPEAAQGGMATTRFPCLILFRPTATQEFV
ncbi:MAG: hypothetical protein JO152_07095 [Mycobacteriaceae bacterium]|nr:hypothetical protein [Mycobacteriaceae bacterium]